MRLGSVFEVTWSGVGRRKPTIASLFRQADRQRMDGLYEEAARLLSQGLDLAPDSSVGHLLMAYLHADLRQTHLARSEFERVLALDPYHPRALLGLARIDLEEGDAHASLGRLDLALQYYPDFPQAAALRDAVGSWSVPLAGAPIAPVRTVGPIASAVAARNAVLARPDGSPIVAHVAVGDGRQPAQHASLIARMASAVLERAGCGPLQHAVIDAPSGRTVLLAQPDRIFSVTLRGSVDIAKSLGAAAQLRTALEAEAA